MHQKNHCKEHGVDNCRDCNHMLAAAQHIANQLGMAAAKLQGLPHPVDMMGTHEDVSIQSRTKGKLVGRPTCGKCPCKELEAELAGLRIENEMNRTAAENGKRKINELNERVVEFEQIKKEHLKVVEDLEVARDVARFATNKREEQLNQLMEDKIVLMGALARQRKKINKLYEMIGDLSGTED